MDKPNIRIAVIGLKGLPAFGGAATVGENIIRELKDKYEFTVYSTSSHTNLKTGKYNGYYQIVFKKIPFKKLNTLYYYILSAFHTLIFENYDLIHLHHRDAAFIIPLLRLRYKVVVTTHNSFVITDKWKKYAWFFQLNERLFIRFANSVISVSKNEVRKFKDNINLDVTYIPNGINPEIIFDEKIDSHGLYIFFGAGRIIRTKALHILLKALHEINYKGKLIVVGDLDQYRLYKNELLSLSHGLDVCYLGLINDKTILLKLIRNAKIFVYPSSIEAMSMMLLEGASMKTPIICSDIIENKDVFNEDEVLFFKTDDYIDLSNKINYAIANENDMKSRAMKAYEKLIKVYNWKIISEKYSEIYDNLLNKN